MISRRNNISIPPDPAARRNPDLTPFRGEIFFPHSVLPYRHPARRPHEEKLRKRIYNPIQVKDRRANGLCGRCGNRKSITFACEPCREKINANRRRASNPTTKGDTNERD